jgi:hypothetical protein
MLYPHPTINNQHLSSTPSPALPYRCYDLLFADVVIPQNLSDDAQLNLAERRISAIRTVLALMRQGEAQNGEGAGEGENSTYYVRG